MLRIHDLNVQNINVKKYRKDLRWVKTCESIMKFTGGKKVL